MYTKAAFKRLPRWARTEIERLKASLAIADASLSNALGVAETRIEVDPYRLLKRDETERPRCFISEDDTIRYHLAGGYVDVKIDGDRLCVRAQDHLVITPNSSNDVDVCNVKFEP